MIISSTSGHACEDTQHQYPYMHDGHLLRLKFSQNVYELRTMTDGHGTLQATHTSGLPGDTVTLTPVPDPKYTFTGYQSTGCTINGNTLTFGAQDCTAKANFYKPPEKVLIGSFRGEFGIRNPRSEWYGGYTYHGIAWSNVRNGYRVAPYQLAYSDIDSTNNTCFPVIGMDGVDISESYWNSVTSISSYIYNGAQPFSAKLSYSSLSGISAEIPNLNMSDNVILELSSGQVHVYNGAGTAINANIKLNDNQILNVDLARGDNTVNLVTGDPLILTGSPVLSVEGSDEKYKNYTMFVLAKYSYWNGSFYKYE